MVFLLFTVKVVNKRQMRSSESLFLIWIPSPFFQNFFGKTLSPLHLARAVGWADYTPPAPGGTITEACSVQSCLPWDIHRRGWGRAVCFLWMCPCEDVNPVLPTQGMEGNGSELEREWPLVVSFEPWIQLSLMSPWTLGYVSN